MELPINIGACRIKRSARRGSWVDLWLKGSEIGSLEKDKLLDDLPRVIGRPLTADEQTLVSNSLPRCAA